MTKYFCKHIVALGPVTKISELLHKINTIIRISGLWGSRNNKYNNVESFNFEHLYDSKLEIIWYLRIQTRNHKQIWTMNVLNVKQYLTHCATQAQ